MEYQQRINNLLEQCQQVWSTLQQNDRGAKGHPQASQDLHDGIKQLVQLQDALDDNGTSSHEIEAIMDKVRAVLQQAILQSKRMPSPKANPVSSRSSPLSSTRLPANPSSLLSTPKAAASILESKEEQLIYHHSAEQDGRIIPDICVHGVSQELEELTLAHSSSSAESSSALSSQWQAPLPSPTGPSSSTATSTEQPFGRRSFTIEEFPELQKDTEKRSKLSFQLWKKPKVSRSSPLPSDAPARINFFDGSAEDQHGMFASDAIVDHPLRIGIGYGSYICYSCTILSNKGTPITVRKRYSDFVDLRDKILCHYPNMKNSIPKLPPKKVVGKFTPSFVEQRRRDLEYFFKYVVLHPTLGSSSVVKHWVAGRTS